MTKTIYPRLPRRRRLGWLIGLALLAGAGCESLEGERIVVPAAHVSVFVPANWQIEKQKGEGGVWLEAAPRGLKGVGLKLLVETRQRAQLDDMVKRAFADVAALEKKSGVKVKDVTQVEIKRGHLHGSRVVHQLELGGGDGKSEPKLELTQITDLLPVDGLALTVLVLGPKDAIATASAEIDRILNSVRSLTPEPETPRTYPPDAVTSASQRAVQELTAPPKRD